MCFFWRKIIFFQPPNVQSPQRKEVTDTFRAELEGRVVKDKMGREFKLPSRTSL